MPAFAHTKPWRVSLMMRSPRRRTMRTDSDSTQRAARVEVVGVERNEAVLGLRHDLLRDDEAVAVGERRVLRARRVGDEHRELVARTDLADARDRDDGERHATAASVSAASAAAISGLRIIVSVTTARTPAASTSAARAASTASITSELQISA